MELRSGEVFFALRCSGSDDDIEAHQIRSDDIGGAYDNDNDDNDDDDDDILDMFTPLDDESHLHFFVPQKRYFEGARVSSVRPIITIHVAVRVYAFLLSWTARRKGFDRDAKNTTWR